MPKGGNGSCLWLLSSQVMQLLLFVATCRLGTLSLQCKLRVLSGTEEVRANSKVQPFLSAVPNSVSFAQEGDRYYTVSNKCYEGISPLNSTTVRSLREANRYLGFLRSDLLYTMYKVSYISSKVHKEGFPNHYFTEESIQHNLPPARAADAHQICYFRNSHGSRS